MSTNDKCSDTYLNMPNSRVKQQRPTIVTFSGFLFSIDFNKLFKGEKDDYSNFVQQPKEQYLLGSQQVISEVEEQPSVQKLTNRDSKNVQEIQKDREKEISQDFFVDYNVNDDIKNQIVRLPRSQTNYKLNYKFYKDQFPISMQSSTMNFPSSLKEGLKEQPSIYKYNYKLPSGHEQDESICSLSDTEHQAKQNSPSCLQQLQDDMNNFKTPLGKKSMNISENQQFQTSGSPNNNSSYFRTAAFSSTMRNKSKFELNQTSDNSLPYEEQDHIITSKFEPHNNQTMKSEDTKVIIPKKNRNMFNEFLQKKFVNQLQQFSLAKPAKLLNQNCLSLINDLTTNYHQNTVQNQASICTRLCLL